MVVMGDHFTRFASLGLIRNIAIHHPDLVVDGNKGIGGGAGASVTGQAVYGCMWSGSNSEMSDSTMKTILQTMGWTIPW